MRISFYLLAFLMLFFGTVKAFAQNDQNVCDEFPPSIEEIEAAAQQGDGYCQAVLGAFYFRGMGVTKDMERAYYWSKQSWEQNHPLGLYNLGYFKKGRYIVEKDLAAQKESYLRAKEGLEIMAKDRPHAGFSLGRIILYELPEGDEILACNIFLTAANLGHPLAQYEYAECLRYGGLGQEDLAGALNWYKKSAEAGSPRSTWVVADIYIEQGDRETALAFYQQAADMTEPVYMYHWAKMLESGIHMAPFDTDPSAAVQYYEKAIEQNHNLSYYRAAWIYWKGAEGVEQNKIRAKEYFMQAASQGDTNAVNMADAMAWQEPRQPD